MGSEGKQAKLSARDNPDNLEAISGLKLSLRKLGRRDRLAVVFHDDAARWQVLREQEFVNRAGEGRREFPSVRDQR
jgi:hypothetical protein